MSDEVNHPAHYGGDTVYEAIKVIEAWGLGMHLGNAVKYISRAGKKGPALQDLKKARWYLDRVIWLDGQAGKPHSALQAPQGEPGGSERPIHVGASCGNLPIEDEHPYYRRSARSETDPQGETVRLTEEMIEEDEEIARGEAIRLTFDVSSKDPGTSGWPARSETDPQGTTILLTKEMIDDGRLANFLINAGLDERVAHLRLSALGTVITLMLQLIKRTDSAIRVSVRGLLGLPPDADDGYEVVWVGLDADGDRVQRLTTHQKELVVALRAAVVRAGKECPSG